MIVASPESVSSFCLFRLKDFHVVYCLARRATFQHVQLGQTLTSLQISAWLKGGTTYHVLVLVHGKGLDPESLLLPENEAFKF